MQDLGTSAKDFHDTTQLSFASKSTRDKLHLLANAQIGALSNVDES